MIKAKLELPYIERGLTPPAFRRDTAETRSKLSSQELEQLNVENAARRVERERLISERKATENNRRAARLEQAKNKSSGGNNSGNNKDPKDNKGPGAEAAAGAAGLHELLKDKPASTPVGRAGDAPMNITASNKSTVINDTKFTGHALDQMQSRGVLSPSAVIDAVQNPTQISPGNMPGTTVFSNDSLTVVANEVGDIVTVIAKSTK